MFGLNFNLAQMLTYLFIGEQAGFLPPLNEVLYRVQLNLFFVQGTTPPVGQLTLPELLLSQDGGRALFKPRISLFETDGCLDGAVNAHYL